KSGILDVLQESCPTKIFLPNSDAFKKGTETTLAPYDFYKIFGLNDVQIGIIANAIPKREYYYTSPLGTRLFNLALGKTNLAFTGISDKIGVKRVNQLYEKHKEEWAYKWLEEKEINYKRFDNSQKEQI
ncbi:conjugal transfer protein TrbE, partial [Campylobacter coli]|nr:conjugal transfer protein TrbE [Campylobacter coli]